jgi:L-ascorbate metabolism protein UlaG (beta-lactamase superfamily)
MEKFPATTLLGCFLVIGAGGFFPATAEILDFRFIGNAAFEISDGDSTLLTDFPYEPGYGGYMYYPLREIKRRNYSLCLISHRHADHFDSKLMDREGCTVLGPEEVTQQVARLEVLPMSEDGGEVEFRTLKVQPVATAHAGIEHYSYLVTWHGYRLYFTGDTEDYEHLKEIEDLDVLFITPWLVRDALDNGVELPGEKWVIYHHRGRIPLSKCEACLVPQQGDKFRLGLE